MEKAGPPPQFTKEQQAGVPPGYDGSHSGEMPPTYDANYTTQPTGPPPLYDYNSPQYGPPLQQAAPYTNSNTVTVNINSGGIPVNGCPVCHNNFWSSSYSCAAWFLLIFFFPIGIILFLVLKDNKCNHCGYTIKHYSRSTRTWTISAVTIIIMIAIGLQLYVSTSSSRYPYY